MPRRETPTDDNNRTNRLLDCADIAFERDPATPLHEDFESIVMEGLLTDKATPVYPPTGHSYPRR